MVALSLQIMPKFRSSGDKPLNTDEAKGELFIVQDPICEVEDEDVEYFMDYDQTFGPGQLKGYCTVRTKNGYEVSGRFRKKRRHGPGLLSGQRLEDLHGVQCIWGNYRQGLLQGHGKVKLPPKGNPKDIQGQGVILDGLFVDGSMEGLVRGQTFKDGQLCFLGRFRKGRPVGKVWIAVQGDCWFYGALDISGDFTGKDNVFIFPDFNTVLIGEFRKGCLVGAVEGKISGIVMKNGLVDLKVTRVGDDVFRYWPSTKTTVSVPWKLPDPYESKMVYATTSKLNDNAGDGLFLRVWVQKGTTVAFYNGIRINPKDGPAPFQSSSYQIYLDWSESKVKYHCPLDLRLLSMGLMQ